MNKKDPNQIDLFTLSFSNTFPDYLKPYAYEILKKLYMDSGGLNINQAYSLFNNYKNEKVREVIDKLSDSYNLIVIDKAKCRGREKRYFLTEYGRKVLTEHYKTI